MLRWLCGWPNIISFLSKGGWDYPFCHHSNDKNGGGVMSASEAMQLRT